VKLLKRNKIRLTRDFTSYVAGLGIVAYQLAIADEQNPAAWVLAGAMITGPNIYRRDDKIRDKAKEEEVKGL
jgi:hypothetical protein